MRRNLGERKEGGIRKRKVGSNLGVIWENEKEIE